MNNKKLKINWYAFYEFGGFILLGIIATVAELLPPMLNDEFNWGWQSDDTFVSVSNTLRIVSLVLIWVPVLVSVLSLFFNKKPARSGIFAGEFLLHFLGFLIGIISTLLLLFADFSSSLENYWYQVDQPEWFVSLALLVLWIMAAVWDSIWFVSKNRKEIKQA